MGIKDMNSPDAVNEQYATTTNLTTRAQVWRGDEHGRTPQDVALALVVAEAPARYADLGCGPGVFTAKVAAALPECSVVGLDQSQAMVDEAASRGLTTILGDIEELPFGDGELDVVSAMWMLYHVPNVDRALDEVRRVLKPGGLFLVTTNSDEHLSDLKRDAGIHQDPLPFSAENGPEILRRHFDSVDMEIMRTRAIFDSSDAVARYLETMGKSADALEPFAGERTYYGAAAIITCR